MKKIKLMLILMSIVLFLPEISSANAQWSATHTYDKGYIVGSGYEVYSDMFSKTLLTVTNENWFASVWIGNGLQDEGGVLEIDYTIGHTFKSGKLKIFTKIDWYDVSGPENLGFDNVYGDVLHPSLQGQYLLNKSGNVFLFGEVAYYVVMDNSKNNGSFTNIGVGYKYQQGNLGVALKGQVGFEESFQTDKPFTRLDLSTSYTISKTIMLSGPGVKFIDASGSGSSTSYTITSLGVRW